jgi:hypothetical protein
MPQLDVLLSQARNREGLLSPQVETAITEAIDIMQRTGQKASVVITLNMIQHTGPGARPGDTLVTGKVTAKLPAENTKDQAGFVFVGRNNALTTEPPQTDAFGDTNVVGFK